MKYRDDKKLAIIIFLIIPIDSDEITSYLIAIK